MTISSKKKDFHYLEFFFYRTDDLWDRLSNCYDALAKIEGDAISFDSLKTLLWLSLSLEDVDNDEEVKNVQIMSFGMVQWFVWHILVSNS